jgi:hypothetical protein
MKKLKFQPSFLQVVYLIIYLILFSLIVYVPTLISGPVHITKKLIFEEEVIEGSLLGILFFINLLVLYLYKKEESRQKELIKKIRIEKKTTEEKLVDAFKYIGQINVQMQEIKSIFNNTTKFPGTKNDFKKTLLFFSEQTFGIVNSNWVLFRIIDCSNQKTIIEHFENRLGYNLKCPHISNRNIIEKQSCSPFTVVISNPPNLNILTCCIIPQENVTNDEMIFLQAITNEITMMFVLLESLYYNNGNKLLALNTDKINMVLE